MKKVLFLVAFVVILAGCKKDSNDEETKNNSIKYNGEEYSLSKGVLENYGKVYDMESYNMDLTLMSSGLVIHEVDGAIDSLSGIGNILYFEIFTSKSGELDNGTYDFDAEETYEPGTFDFGTVGLNLNAVTLEGEKILVESGTIKINQTGDEFEITVNCKNETGKTITAYYKGELNYYDYTADLKHSKLAPSFFKRIF